MISPVSILFTIPNFITAGSGRAMLNIIERLDRSRFSPVVAVLKRGGKLEAEVEQLGIPLIEAPFTVSPKPYTSLLPRARQAAQVFRPYGFALWHSFHYTDDYTEALIAYSAGVRGWIYTKKNMNWNSRAWRTRSLLARRIAAQNHDMLVNFFSSPFFKGKTRLIPRGVDTQKFHPGVLPRLKLRARLCIPTGASLIACVAELVPVKGHPILLQALARVPSVHLLLAGRPMDETYSGALRKQVTDLRLMDRVHFLGGVEDVPALLAECDLFVLPTLGRGRMEGCPVALLEAMASGKACIATDIPGSHDLIPHGQCGLIVPAEDPNALADTIQLVLGNTNLAQKLGYSACQRVEQHYTIDREVSDHVRLYDEILGNPPA